MAQALVAGLILAAACAPQPSPDGFVRIFDGETLAGWRAVPEQLRQSWSVQDGAIQGHGLEDRLAYLVYAGDEDLGNFELKIRYKMLTDGNTGIEVRGRPDATAKRPFEGYHADLGHVGIGPGILGAWDLHFATRKEFPGRRGMRLLIEQDGQGRLESLEGHIQVGDIAVRGWNSCRIVARGDHLQFFINGLLSSELIDRGDAGRLNRGLVALQIHDKGTVVQFRDILLRRLL
ncbi:MAG: DUF1080 domain-containing protein [Bryobacterales bacterium]|nr:DUF1080 domain-containing protein [Bryobacterales bacterium]